MVGLMTSSLHGCSNSTILLHQKTVCDCVAHEENGTCVYVCVCVNFINKHICNKKENEDNLPKLLIVTT